MSKKSKPQSIKQVLKKFEWDKKKYISREFQDYGCRLAHAMDDEKHVSLYIKLAKEVDRALLEKAKNFVKGAYNVKSKPKLFMWKLKQLRDDKTKGSCKVKGKKQPT